MKRERKGFDRKGFKKYIYYAGDKMRLYTIFDERTKPSWQNTAQSMIDYERKVGSSACVIHKGDLHGLYIKDW